MCASAQTLKWAHDLFIMESELDLLWMKGNNVVNNDQFLAQVIILLHKTSVHPQGATLICFSCVVDLTCKVPFKSLGSLGTFMNFGSHFKIWFYYIKIYYRNPFCKTVMLSPVQEFFWELTK